VTKFLLALHLVFAVFAVGPLVHAATTAGRGIRRGDAAATASSARLLRIYAYASTLVVVTGIVLMYRNPFSLTTGPRFTVSILTDNPRDFSLPSHIASFGQTWIWLSLVLWVVALALILFLAVPTLNRASKGIAAGDSVVALTARVAAAGGIVGLIFVVIVVLMVYRPGQ
jgi:uncharacterized membrane protein